MSLKNGFVRSLTLAATLVGVNTQAAQLNITLAEVTKSVGNIRIAVYSSEFDFATKPLHAISVPATTGQMEFNVAELPAGNYSVMLFQDINGNGKLDSNLLGIPREPWGGSLGGKTVFGPPKWKDTWFELPHSGATISIKLRSGAGL